MTTFAGKQKAMWLMMVCTLTLVAGSAIAAGKYDGNWLTKMSCEAHGETPAYSWQFPSTIENGNYHGQHSAPGEPGYLLVEGKIADDGTAKLSAKGTVEKNNAHGVFAMKGNNYSYTIKAQFGETSGTGKRDEGAGILGRPCTFEFTKQDASAQPEPNAKPQGTNSKL
jgi:hypothetical protein